MASNQGTIGTWLEKLTSWTATADEKLDSLAAENKALREKLEASQVEKVEIQNRTTEVIDQTEKATEQLDERTALLAAQEERLTALEATLKEQAAKIEEQAQRIGGAKAAEVISALGVDPAAEEPNESPAKKSVLETFNELTGAEKTKFYRANKEAIYTEHFKTRR